ncbi:hypothetical protein L207DRAFT_633764 [Hyaloscypha variabilis F]|uniref:Uncharacterized protein n=1 Tax=Hyaloscypha variabilis (strain UAMH 11265 / GT02V1 / F) TaxID=1149755 RepID=A0A2J6RQK5_HYAVF|nr:hypothetical protein L207DRAFT_633764 [Hyaloscypha variabilis F]
MGVDWHDDAAILEEFARKKGEGAKASDSRVFQVNEASADLHWGPTDAKGGCVKASETTGFADIGGRRRVHSVESEVYVGPVESYQNAAMKWIR